jgi:diguanylate cyclase (GGDEF)-like protein
MRASTTPILLVSPVANSIAYETMLRRNNFLNIARCSDAVSALQYLESNPAHIIISEVEMNDMDGFELTNHLREIERTDGRYSYVILIAQQNMHNKVELTWQSKVDAIINRDVLPFRLIPQIMSGERISNQLNQLLADNKDFRTRCDKLELGQLLDPLTGLGNRRQAEKGLEDTIRQIEARGGAVCLLMVSVRDLVRIEQAHNPEIVDELIVALAGKIRRLVRPLDIVTYFDKGLFAVIMQHNKLHDCTAQSYRRIFNGVALKHYPTKAGYINPKIIMGACGASAETGPPKVDMIIETAMENLGRSDSTGELCVSTLNQEVDFSFEGLAAHAGGGK